jgi:hypothetical protein
VRKRWKLLLALTGTAVIGGCAPILYVETACRSAPPGHEAAAPFRSALPGAEGRRDEARTWLTYPEWYIVYSAESYGRYLAAGTAPSGYGYARDVSGFWAGLCAVNQASAPAGGAGDAKLMLYTIGLSFSAEMLVKGAYENTLGRLAEWVGGHESQNDRYNASVWRIYGGFMHETPWYLFPFGQALSGLWQTEGDGARVRHWERRFALSLEYGVKAVYAGLLGWASGAALGRDERTLRFVARAEPGTVAAIDPRLRPVGRLPGGRVVVEAPRYAQFSDLLLRLSATRVQLEEIAGNDDIFVTLLLPAAAGAPAGAAALIETPLPDRPGWRRVGVTAKVPRLLDLLRATRAAGGEVEHVYDY